MTTKISSLILAGGEFNDFITQEKMVKGLIDIGGRPMVEYILSALEGCPSIDRIVIILPSIAKSKQFNRGRAEVVYSDKDFIDNIDTGIKYLDIDREDLILITSTDTPLIEPVGLENFIQKCLRMGGDGFYPIMIKEDIQKKFPTTKRTYVPLKEGTICGGNLLLIRKLVFDDSINYLHKLYMARKSILGMLRVIGFWSLLKFLFRSLSVADIEKRASKMIGARLRGVPTDYVELSIDVDKKEDFALVEERLRKSDV